MNRDTDIAMRQRNHLPHFDLPDGIYLVTYCLADAFPPGFVTRLDRDRRCGLARVRERFDVVKSSDVRQLQRHFRRELFSEMDKGYGSCATRKPEIAQIVADSLEHFDGERYRLICYAVMPNHVHVMFRTFPDYPWWKVIGGSKSFTAKQANRVLGRSGTFWQDDNYDTLIQSARHFENAIDYVMANPGKAGLSDWPWVRKFGCSFDD